MPNQPRRNAQGCPGLIYRIDFREPSEIFEHGFQPWGSNTNFFEHVLGRTIGDELPEERRSGIISASDSPNSSLRFFGGMLNEPEDPLEYYLYEIRADENVYSAERTASFYHQRISTGLIDFSEGDLETAVEAVDSIFQDFAYQREWFNVGPIPRERVRSAWRIDSVSILPNHIRHPGRTVYYTPRINEPEILNEHYVDADTYANNLPFTDGATLLTPSTVSVPSQLVESDATGGVSASLGFACELPPSSPHRDARSLKGNGINCYFDTKKVILNLKKEKQERPLIFSKVFPSKVYLKGQKSKKEFVLSVLKVNNGWLPILVDLKDKDVIKTPLFIFNSFHCLEWNDNTTKLSFALAPVKIGKIQSFYEAQYLIAAINDDSQKWNLELINNSPDECTFRIRNIELHDFCLKREINSGKLWIRPIKEEDDENFEEMHIVVAENRCDTCILLPQDARTKLVDISLSWFYENVNYVPIPEKNTSKSGTPQKGKFFYDLKTCKIIYIQKNNNYAISALFNNRGDSSWNWVRWRPSDLYPTTDVRYRWYFQNDKWETFNDLNFRNIRSYWKNDYLRVQVSGYSWGSLFTVNDETYYKSIAIFRINPLADI